MRGFARRRGGYVAHLDTTERTILSRVVADTAALFGTRLDLPEQPPEDPLAALEWSESELAEPTDPALARLLPPASQDSDVASEFRRLTDSELRSGKVARLRMVWDALGTPGERLVVAPEQAMDWAAALTDIRLVVAERLEVRTDEDAEEIYSWASKAARGSLTQDEEIKSAMASLYMVLTWLQESLVTVMTRAL